MSHRTTLLLFAVLLVSDALMLALHVGYVRTTEGLPVLVALRNPAFNLTRDGGLAEVLEYLKSAATVAALFLISRRGGGRLFLALAGVHAWFLADNLFRLHERAGALAGLVLVPDGALTLASRDIGQPIAFAIIGAGLSFLVWRGWREATPSVRRAGGLLVLTAGSIALFAVFIDALHASRLGPRFGETFWILLEDGGETVVLSLNCALAVGFAVASGVRLWPVAAVSATGGSR